MRQKGKRQKEILNYKVVEDSITNQRLSFLDFKLLNSFRCYSKRTRMRSPQEKPAFSNINFKFASILCENCKRYNEMMAYELLNVKFLIRDFYNISNKPISPANKVKKLREEQ